jgi:hypothetical protein
LKAIDGSSIMADLGILNMDILKDGGKHDQDGKDQQSLMIR